MPAQNQISLKDDETGNPNQGYSKPIPCGKSVGEIKALAVATRKQMEYSPEIKFSTVLGWFGGKLVEMADWDELPKGKTEEFRFANSSIFVEDERDFTIYTLEMSDTQGRRFDIAHELGHYILHYLLPRSKKEENAPMKLMACRNLGGDEESEANWFAMAYLIDEELFRDKCQEYNYNKYLLADYFHVTPIMIVCFGQSIGLFQEEPV
ncbi:MAG: ImmA/IrrE family metallo-endopeptidase [Candidatus Symbiobacter sp.]|nr:ImmA/IrrE family metallo-endopeptidase [Candidatus Symbiobacter sp.]